MHPCCCLLLWAGDSFEYLFFLPRRKWISNRSRALLVIHPWMSATSPPFARPDWRTGLPSSGHGIGGQKVNRAQSHWAAAPPMTVAVSALALPQTTSRAGTHSARRGAADKHRLFDTPVSNSEQAAPHKAQSVVYCGSPLGRCGWRTSFPLCILCVWSSAVAERQSLQGRKVSLYSPPYRVARRPLSVRRRPHAPTIAGLAGVANS